MRSHPYDAAPCDCPDASVNGSAVPMDATSPRSASVEAQRAVLPKTLQRLEAAARDELKRMRPMPRSSESSLVSPDQLWPALAWDMGLSGVDADQALGLACWTPADTVGQAR